MTSPALPHAPRAGDTAFPGIASAVHLPQWAAAGTHLLFLCLMCLPVAGAGALVVALAPGLPTVMVGRLLYGVGIGFAMHAAPAYIAGGFGPSSADSGRGGRLGCGSLRVSQ